ncbi:hypothetical protein VA602_02545 [Pseudomonas sp. MH2]|uniref:AbiTii domain-containing protein n=1 Tax=Pseudomonas machongensis TaxID=3110229 RepID=A0ABU5VA27_9PSED|nr:hypothetical protein [Pseudomonas sp. MH2]MEA5670213.1 hypothetical protein [Pseudomonas sp. MH2]
MTKKMAEMMDLAKSILDDVEMCTASLTQVALRTSRLARLTARLEDQQIFLYEASGYPSSPNGVPSNVWKLLAKSGRIYKVKDLKEPSKLREHGLTASIDEMESTLSASRIALEAATNPMERNKYLGELNKASARLASRRAYLHSFVSEVYYELKFSEVAYDVFNRTREGVDRVIGTLVPDAVRKFTAIYENLDSTNTEDWSNAVHSCRRILQDTADALYPAREDKIVKRGNKDHAIKLGPDNYINRLVAYVEDNSDSERFDEIVGSHMKYLGERLDAIFKAAQKGSHSVISSQDEADRYVIYTYLVVGDILKLREERLVLTGNPSEEAGHLVDTESE